MRIGLMCHWGYGGSSKMTVALARELVAAGHQVHLFARLRPGCHWELPAAVTVHDAAPVRSVDPRPDRLDIDWTAAELSELTAQVVSVVDSDGLEILHFHYALPFAAAASQVRRRLGPASPRLVGTLHGTDVSLYGRHPALGRHLECLDALTTVSASHAALASEVFGLAQLPEVIPNSVDLRRWRPRPNRTESARRPPRIAHVSNFRPVKASPSVARVFAAVHRQAPCALWLIGEGEEMPLVDTILAQSGVLADVRHFGLRPDVHRVLPRADVLLMTSRAESFCLAALEAQAAGVPVVASRVGGLPEVVDDGVTGLLFDVDDEASAADAVLSLVGDPEYRALLGKRGVERARTFSGEIMVSRYLALYRRLLSAPAAGPEITADHCERSWVSTPGVAW